MTKQEFLLVLLVATVFSAFELFLAAIMLAVCAQGCLPVVAVLFSILGIAVAVGFSVGVMTMAISGVCKAWRLR